MQSELRCGGARLGELELLNSELSEQLATLQSQLDTVTTQAEADKRAALEQWVYLLRGYMYTNYTYIT